MHIAMCVVGALSTALWKMRATNSVGQQMRNYWIVSILATSAAIAVGQSAMAATLSLDINPPRIVQVLPHDTTVQTSTTSQVKTTYSNSLPSLSGLDLTASGVTTPHTKTEGDDHHRHTVTTYSTAVTAGEVESYSYAQTKTVTDFTRTVTHHGGHDDHHGDDGVTSFGPWTQSGSPTVTNSTLQGSGSGSTAGSFDGQTGTVTIDYDFSLSPGNNLALTLLDSTGITGLTVSLESFGTVLKTWTSDGTVLLPTLLGNFTGDNRSDDLYHIAVTATGFGNGSHFDIHAGVSAVPLPAALPLFGAAVFGFAAWGRKRRARRPAA